MYTIQPLTEQLLETYSQSYLETLAPLSPIGKHTIDSLQETLKIMQTQGTSVFIALDDAKGIIGTCSILIERKFNRGGSQAAHLEDLSVHPSAQGKGVGTALLQHIKQFAVEQGCYKIILDCDPSLEDRYAKNGFHKGGSMMKIGIN